MGVARSSDPVHCSGEGSGQRIAIVHEWMIHYGGGVERVATALSRIFPEADHFALVHDKDKLRGSPLESLRVSTSVLQRFPFSRRMHRLYLPLMPMAIEALDVSKYEIVISLSHAVAKGVLTTSEQLHVCYLQARNLKYAYDDRSVYSRGGGVRRLLEDYFLCNLRVWDSVASRRPDVTVSNSRYVRDWHEHRHGISSEVVYPPVNLDAFTAGRSSREGDYYVTVGRLEPYKRTDVVVDAFRRLGRKLIVVGDGTELKRLRQSAVGSPNISFAGLLSTLEVADVVRSSRAFVFAAREDFGIAPLEALACGVPVIAYGDGGACETVRAWPAPNATGIHFREQTAHSLIEAVLKFEGVERDILSGDCSRFARGFSEEVFAERLRMLIDREWKSRARTRPS